MPEESILKFHPFLMLRTPCISHQQFSVSKTKEQLKNPLFLAGIYLASPSFYHILKAANFNWELLTDKAKLSLNKYHNRMSFRPTPFASFAAFGNLRWQNNDTTITFDTDEDILHIQLDHQINCALIERLKTENGEDDKLWNNPSLYKVAQEFRYIKTIRKTDKKFDFRLAAISADGILKSIIKKTKKTGISKKVLKAEIIRTANCTEEEAKDYIQFLLSEEILMSSLGPTLVRAPFLNYASLDQSKFKLHEGDLLEPKIKVSSLSAQTLEAHFKKVEEILSEEDLKDLKTPYYANLERKFVGGLSKEYQESILKAIEMLQKLIPSHTNQNLLNFSKKFSQRYDQQKVGLLNVLDPEIGLGYGKKEQLNTEQLLDDLPFASSATNLSLTWDKSKQLLFKKWLALDKVANNERINLSKEDIKHLSKKADTEFPPSLFVMFRLLDDQVFIENAGGISAAALTGRFTLFNDEIWKQCRDIALLEQAQQPEVIFAELVQHSSYHVDNINLRQSIYDYEIPINGISRLPEKQQIPLSDLTLKLIGNELILESISLKRRVIPRLSTAFNAQWNELSAFRFLFDLQCQHLQGNFTLNLEEAFPGLNYYPRVTYENTILCLAKWKWVESDIQILTEVDKVKSKASLTLLKEKLNFPDVIAITRHDHQLVFDLKKNEEVELFISCLKGLKNIWVLEYPFLKISKNRIKDKADEPFTGQFIAHLIHQKRTYHTLKVTDFAKKPIKRTFTLGDEWLYIKLYCSQNFSNKLLGKEVFGLIKKLAQSNDHMIWFFIRYQDPEPQIRLRIKKTGFENLDLEKLVFTALDKLVQKGFIHPIQTDSYVRELERYQLYGMNEVEKLFYRSSQLVLQFIRKQQTQADLFIDHQFALYSVNRILDVYITEIELKLNFLQQLFSKFYAEFSKDKSLNVALDKKYRAQKDEIYKVLEDKKYIQNRRLGGPFKQLLNSLNDQKDRNKDLTIEQKNALLADLIHMHLNRLFQQNQRQQEMIVYHFLAKYQKSQLART